MSQRLIGHLSEQLLINSGIRVGLASCTKDMQPYVHKVNSVDEKTVDGVNLFNINTIVERIEIAAKYLCTFNPENVLVYSSFPQCEVALPRLAELTEFNCRTNRFMPGCFTNAQSPDYVDTEVLLLLKPREEVKKKKPTYRVVEKGGLEMQAIEEAAKIGIPVIAFCDTDNTLSNIDFVIPGNTKSPRAVATAFYMLATSVLENRGIKKDLTVSEFEAIMELEDAEEEEPRYVPAYVS